MTLRRGIHVKDVHLGYGETRVLKGLTLSVARGEFVALVGPSGAGKTSLLRCIARLAEAERGEIYAAGHAMHALSGAALRAARRDIAFIFQQFNLVRRRTALANAVSGALFDMPLWRVVSGAFSQDDRKSPCRRWSGSGSWNSLRSGRIGCRVDSSSESQLRGRLSRGLKSYSRTSRSPVSIPQRPTGSCSSFATSPGSMALPFFAVCISPILWRDLRTGRSNWISPIAPRAALDSAIGKLNLSLSSEGTRRRHWSHIIVKA